jgi:hypothetical protein
MGRVIFTTFAGRRGNLKLLFYWVKELVDRGSVDEFHIWNYTKDEIVDEPWLLKNIPEKAQLFSPENKANWDEYYKYYTPDKYDPMDVIVKADDDIAFIDVEQFDAFIERKRQMVNYPLAFPSIINNRVCAFAQRMYGFLDPKEFTDDVLSALWTNTTVCEYLHQFFITNFEAFLDFSRKANHYVLDPPEMMNINFFAVLGQDLALFQKVPGHNDEEFLSSAGIHYIDMSFVVSHLAFSAQRCDGFNDELFQTKYTLLKDKYSQYTRNGGPDSPTH